MMRQCLAFMLATGVSLLVRPSAGAAAYTVVREFGIGGGDGQLGFVVGDTQESGPSFSVGADGGIAIADDLNGRLVSIGPDGSGRFIAGAPPGVGPTAGLNSVLGLADGSVAAQWATTLVLYDSVGSVVRRVDGVVGTLEAETPDGAIVIHDRESRRYSVLARDLKVLGRYEEMPLSVGAYRDLGSASVVKVVGSTRCFLFDGRKSGWGGQHQIYGDELLMAGRDAIRRVDGATNTLTVWRPTRDALGSPLEANAIRAFGSPILGRDRNFYGLLRDQSRI